MKLRSLRPILLPAFYVALGLSRSLAAGPALEISIVAPSAGLQSITVGGRPFKIAGGGGFTVRNAAGRDAVDLPSGAITGTGPKIHFQTEKAGDLRLEADFSDHGQYVLVTGYVENLRPGDRGLIVDYRVPFAGSNLVFGNDLNHSGPAGAAETEGSVYPIAAMHNSELGLALAIPPSAPCEFGMVGSSHGLAVRYYLGVSAETRNFPNRAAFAFILYPVESSWGFRSALSQYYAFYPDYYNDRSGHAGQFIFLAEDGKETPPVDLSHFTFTCVETQAPWLQQFLDRDQKNGILSLPYMIVGMREIKFLPVLPKTYDAAMRDYAGWTAQADEGHPVGKEAESAGRDVNLHPEVDGSTCTTAAGKLAIAIRHTAWGLNSVSFKTNPNPDLFADTGGQSVGGNALKRIDEWCRLHPEIDGVTIDSLGGNWPANFNYRRDHFRYARYPLTCDATGRVALHNEISHYEFLETLRDRFRNQSPVKPRYIAANGIYSYLVRPDLPQHYRLSTAQNRIGIGRFFLGSLLDFAVSEPGITSSDQSLEFMRTAMGRKIYSPTNARFENAAKVRDWVNKCLCYDLFGVNVRRYGDPIANYYPDGYQRDKALWDWFVPKARLLAAAGWQPVTGATGDGKKLCVERYGSGNAFYLAVLSEDAGPQNCVLNLDLKALGLGTEGASIRLAAEDIAQQAPVQVLGDHQLSLPLQPYRTSILAVRKI